MGTDSAKLGTYGERYGPAFQQHILAVAARLPSFVAQFRSALDHHYFEAVSHQRIAQALLAHVDQYRGLPTQTTLVEETKAVCGARDDKTAVEAAVLALYRTDVSDAEAVEALAVEFGKQQAMTNAVISAADAIANDEREKVMPLIQEALLVGEDVTDIGIDYTHADAERATWYAEGVDAKEYIPTGSAHLDMLLGGHGMRRGELTAFMGVPKMGKTTVLVNLGIGAARAGFNVAHFSCEMGQVRIGERYDACISGQAWGLRGTDTAAYVAAINRVVKDELRGNLLIKQYRTRSLSVSGLRSRLSLLHARGITPDLVIADYGDIMKPERRLGEIRHEQAGIYEDLRSLAEEFHCHVVSATQANRMAVSKDVVTMADIAESLEKVAISDAVVAICQTMDERVAGRCRLFAAAMRNAPDYRTVECLINRDRCHLRSVALYDVDGTMMVGDGSATTSGDAARVAVGLPQTYKPPLPGDNGNNHKHPKPKPRRVIGGPNKRLNLG